MVPKVCSIDGCSKPSQRRGWCGMHYQRWYRHGDPADDRGYFQGRPEDAFNYRTRRDESGCLVWVGGKLADGYGTMRAGGKVVRAHRYAWERVNGPIPLGMAIDHTCWNRACVEVAHLRLATWKQNGENLSGAHRNGKSGVRGVYLDKKSGKWRAQVRSNYRTYATGTFDSIEEATVAARGWRAEAFTHAQN